MTTIPFPAILTSPAADAEPLCCVCLGRTASSFGPDGSMMCQPCRDNHTVAGFGPAADLEDQVYIAGPMTGYPDHNHPTFTAAAEWLRGAGFRVISPHELHQPGAHPWDWYLRRDLAELVKCTRIVMLPGWDDSRGARLEHTVAKALGLQITYPHEIGELLRGASA